MQTDAERTAFLDGLLEADFCCRDGEFYVQGPSSPEPYSELWADLDEMSSTVRGLFRKSLKGAVVLDLACGKPDISQHIPGIAKKYHASAYIGNDAYHVQPASSSAYSPTRCYYIHGDLVRVLRNMPANFASVCLNGFDQLEKHHPTSREICELVATIVPSGGVAFATSSPAFEGLLEHSAFKNSYVSEITKSPDAFILQKK